MSRKVLLVVLAAAALVAVVVIGVLQAPEAKTPQTGGESQPLDQKEVRRKLDGAPAPLAALHRQANELVPGGRQELGRRLASVKGYPAVVNVWAAWCGPCIVELPVLQQLSLDYGRQVAFLGIDYRDNRERAQRLLRRIPVAYPSVEDPKGKVFASYKLIGTPSTIFYDSSGQQTYVHQGPYQDRESLEQDIRRYALGRA